MSHQRGARLISLDAVNVHFIAVKIGAVGRADRWIDGDRVVRVDSHSVGPAVERARPSSVVSVVSVVSECKWLRGRKGGGRWCQGGACVSVRIECERECECEYECECECECE